MTARPLVALALLACGPSTTAVQRSKTVSYQADFALVWNAVVEVVRRDYKDIKFEDASKGVIATEWQPIRTSEDNEDQRPEGEPDPRSHDVVRIAAKVFRVRVEVPRGGPPWRVKVFGEAARYEPGLTMLIPYQRGAIDEPVWVQPRIDRLYVAIYERLEKYAVDTGSHPAGVAKRTFDTSAWPNLPPEAQRVLGEVRAACAKKDPAAIRPHMTDPFASSVGSVPPDQTVAIWAADPTELGQMQAALDKGCDADPSGQRITCPKAGTPGPRATFQLAAGAWKLTSFAE